MRVLGGVAKILALIALLSGLIFWTLMSTKVVRLSLAAGGECKWELNRWLSGKCVFSYYEEGNCKGEMTTYRGLFERPVGVFPGPNPKVVIGIYELDTTVAVFAIDLTDQDVAGIAPPERLRGTVLFSNFRTRACTGAEVVYLKNYISSSTGPLWQNTFALYGRWVDRAKVKRGLLTSLALGTIPHEERDAESRNHQHPQIPPEN
jgi:hypothetical protein